MLCSVRWSTIATQASHHDAEGFHVFMELADTVEIPNHQIKLVRLQESKEGWLVGYRFFS